ncbi:CRM-domain containing factor CFM2, chloroplastic-like isoform X2 [Papaver somniferum]|uniref:CRM-domain containing factor CFM2, chloroplastic-like isoform X2 n=1 Tax=Papaver somniferum TaxID=3469 RepID=UPI000E6FAC9B|nr:CRM-domain containing factor CFM2, chloroplastic-like isoform X2 [Papaver somniferum]
MLLHQYHLSSPFPINTLNSSQNLFLFSKSNKTSPNFSKPFVTNSSNTSITTKAETVSKTAIERIAEKLRNLGYIEENKENPEHKINNHTGTAGEIFLPFTQNLPKQRVGYTIDTSWSTPENPVPRPGSGNAISRFRELKRQVVKERRVERDENEKLREEKVPTLAELTIPQHELRRIRKVGIELKKKLKVGVAGITEGIVNGIHERWRRSEVVKIKCEDLSKLNMKRTHDLLERKTGGLVVWRSGSIIILYRGANYVYPYFLTTNTTDDTSGDELVSLPNGNDGVTVDEETNLVCTDSVKSGLPIVSNREAGKALVKGVGSPNKVRFLLPGEAQILEEADRMLDGLGPRFIDWWGVEPLPIDADLLPAIVPGYRRPFRLLPYGIKPKLTDDEMTILRRLGRPLPCHFALGRNKNLQGLAASIVKLWEKCEIAKIAVKRGVQNTNSLMMAEELKRLTGGTLLSRDKEFIALYRGKDFLPPAVSTAIEDRRKPRIHRDKHTTHGHSSTEISPSLASKAENSTSAGEFHEKSVRKERKPKSTNAVMENTSSKLFTVLAKKEKAEKLLAKLESEAEAREPEVDREGVTEEERYMLKKVGLRMKPFLLLGRRGVFDGTIENMHLHWKYRELVKIMASARGREDVYGVAKTLEAESGGILVAVERVDRGYAIIVYRGKNYQRPADLRPQTLLNKKQAMKRSLEAQRCESLKLHVLKLAQNIDDLKVKLVEEELENCKINHEPLTEQQRERTQFEVAQVSQVKEESEDLEINHVSSTEKQRETTQFKTSDSLGSVVKPQIQKNAGSVEFTDSPKAMEAHVSYLTSLPSDQSMDDLEEDTHLEKLMNYTPEYEEFDNTDLESKPEEVVREIHSVNFQEKLERIHEDSFRGNLQGDAACAVTDKAEGYASEPESVESSVEPRKNQLESSVQGDKEQRGSKGVRFRAQPLSNRERLILRKQALTMKRRPVLAIGRSNVVTGVAKAIKTHFQKNALAIVNVKGRAKGTSIQELVFKLEKATGAVMVSQEPNKVILYRGWEEGGEDPRGGVTKGKAYSKKSSGRVARNKNVVSPELMAAIRLECGLASSKEAT